MDPLSWPTRLLKLVQLFAFHDVKGLIRSAKEGCHLCNLIVAELPESKLTLLRRDLELNQDLSSRQLFVRIDHSSRFNRGDYILGRVTLTCSTPSIYQGISYDIMPIFIADMRGK